MLIQEIKEALAKATPGPWKYQHGGFYGNNHLVYEVSTDNLICMAKTHEKTEENLIFIANAPTWLQQAVEIMERQQHDLFNSLSLRDFAVKRYNEQNKEIERMRAALVKAESALGKLLSFYGEGLMVHNWHQNGDGEPWDTFFDHNMDGDELEVIRAALEGREEQ